MASTGIYNLLKKNMKNIYSYITNKLYANQQGRGANSCYYMYT